MCYHAKSGIHCAKLSRSSVVKSTLVAPYTYEVGADVKNKVAVYIDWKPVVYYEFVFENIRLSCLYSCVLFWHNYSYIHHNYCTSLLLAG